MAEFDLSAFTFGEDEGKTMALGVTGLAEHLTRLETDAERRRKKQRIVELKYKVLAALGFDTERIRDLLSERTKTWDETKRNALLIELAFAAPFAPYEVKVTSAHRELALAELAEHLGLSRQRVADIDESIKSARKSHRHIPWSKIAAGAIVGTAVVAVGGWVAAPYLAALLGEAAGLAGAAAVAHGLALLGGGSLAAGGAGMAGGMALVTTVAGAAGGIGVGGGTALWQMGKIAAVSELVKLQVSYREVLLRSHLRSWMKDRIIERLRAQLEVLRKQIADEATLNDRGVPRIENLEAIARGYADAISWLEKQSGTQQ